MNNKEVYQIWKSSCNNDNEVLVKHYFNLIVNRYSEKHRFYHTLSHVKDLLVLVRSENLPRKEKIILFFSVFFHDVIYDSNKKDNELKSADFMVNCLTDLDIEPTVIHSVDLIIKATIKHQSNDLLTQLFLDMDLSILGSSSKRYLLYSKQIRQEHQFTPPLFYQIGRIRFLKQILAQTSIYSTSTYCLKYEKIARNNIINELKSYNYVEHF